MTYVRYTYIYIYIYIYISAISAVRSTLRGAALFGRGSVPPPGPQLRASGDGSGVTDPVRESNF